MGAEIIFGFLLAVMLTVLGSATIYQAVILKDPRVVDGQVVLKRLTPPLMLQLVVGCIYLFVGVLLFGVNLPVVQGES